MAKVIVRQEAIDDLNDRDYTYEKWSENQAEKHYAAIKLACNGIGKNPTIGRKYNEISDNLLGLKLEKHIIFYQRISNEEVEVIRILNERMDLKNRITE